MNPKIFIFKFVEKYFLLEVKFEHSIQSKDTQQAAFFIDGSIQMQLLKTESTTIWDIGKIQISNKMGAFDECVQCDLTF